MKANKYLILIIFSSGSFLSCNKDFLEKKQQQSLVIPASLSDFQSLLDNRDAMTNNSCHELGIIGADEYSVSDAVWNVLSAPYQKYGYIWAKDVYEGAQLDEWNMAYWRILHANTALDGVKQIKPAEVERQLWNNVKGSGLFFRAYNFYQLAQQFCKPYSATASTDPGLPLRLEADIDLLSRRSTVAETYSQIIEDLLTAAPLLPDLPLVKFRPSKASAYALLAKVYLLMANYEKANEYAGLSLAIKSDLIDFKTLSLSARYPFPSDYELNKEVILAVGISNIAITGTARMNVVPDILNNYTTGDLRRQAYFFNNADGRVLFKGSYKGSAAFYTGLATDEVFLIRAESYARMGDKENALKDLNTLRKARFTVAAYQDLAASDANEALRMVIEERRRELIFRGIRWEDLRRLNAESAFSRVIRRTVAGTTYELLPGDNKYVWPLPDNEVTLSKIEQNPR
ncbi:RagB/SusD family nutrient uptake outer membrane protein [Pedobacter deserti]|uniref:RagB/SusD family nutrient uptake outer membrane protein n=1 Tax=Pedobacter deserti TaxID=2817382 RepID=UPI00210C139B|nr:RagB/SusD family nutrient uptake outer membrane protein [Pedobacter sp. SYSU D00382]